MTSFVRDAIVTRRHAFSRALRQLHVITSSFDWFTVLSVFFVIGQSNYFGFGFTTLERKPLYDAKSFLKCSVNRRGDTRVYCEEHFLSAESFAVLPERLTHLLQIA